jgi:MFS family permease
LCLGNISNYLGYVLPANLLTYIDEDIGPSPNITWVSISYTLGLSVGFLIVGRFSDIFGRRWFFIVGNGFGLLGSIVGATAKNVNTLIGADVLMGLAGAVQISFTVAVSELVPNKVRPLAVSAIFFSSFEIACFGPVIGISLENGTKLTWRWAYYLNIIISGLAVLCFYLFYHPPDFNLLHMDRSKWEQCKRQDGVGFVLFTGGLLLFIMGMSWGGTVHPWNSVYVVRIISTFLFLSILSLKQKKLTHAIRLRLLWSDSACWPHLSPTTPTYTRGMLCCPLVYFANRATSQ